LQAGGCLPDLPGAAQEGHLPALAVVLAERGFVDPLHAEILRRKARHGKTNLRWLVKWSGPIYD
jgi:hypothetical protein